MQVQNASVVIDHRGIWFHSPDGKAVSDMNRRTVVFSQMPADTSSFTVEKQLISFVLKLLNRDFSAGVGLQVRVELIVLLHAGFAGGALRDTGTEFLKVHTYPVEGKAASAVRTFNSRQCLTLVSFCGML